MKKLVLMRGIPGSGKSTCAKQIALSHTRRGGTVVICSTDNFFIKDNGEYEFDASLIVSYHQANQALVSKYMGHGIELIIVDNTNTTQREMEPYKKMAKDFMYQVDEVVMGRSELLEPETAQWRAYTERCASRNVHRVPLESIQKMARRFEL